MEAANIEDGWVNAFFRPLGSWESDQTRSFTLEIPSRALPRPGTYVPRVSVRAVVPMGTFADSLARGLRDLPVPIREEDRDRLYAQGIEAIRRGGHDPAAAAGGQTMEDRLTVTIQEYFRVEPFSTVLTVLGTLVAAVAVLTTIIVALVG